jgi:hypothetical protein
VVRVRCGRQAEGEDEETELNGLSQVLRSFQDTRTFMYGDAEATKLTLLKMRRDADFNRWRVEDTMEEVAFRLASAGIGPKPSIAYWKRSPTASHKNGIFVGRVFDTYLGAAAVSCSLSGLLVGGVAPALSAAARERIEQAQGDLSDEPLALAGTPADLANSGIGAEADGDAPVVPIDSEGAAAIDRAVSALAAKEVPLDLGEYSGLLIRAIGDTNKYTAVIRTCVCPRPLPR